MGKILHIVNSVSYDGAAILSLRIVMMTPQYQHEIISMFKGSGINEFMKNGIVCSYLLDKNSYGLNFKLKKDLALVRYLLKNKYDIIHFHGGGISVLLIAALLKRKASVVFHLHAGNITGIPFKLNLPAVYKFIYRNIDKRIEKVATCEHVRQYYCKEIQPWNIESVHLIRNFTPFNFISKEKPNRRIGYIGRIASEKGIKMFFAVTESVEFKLFNLKTVLMGDFSNDLNGFIRKKIDEGIVDLLSPSLCVEELYKKVDILIFPSLLTETLPLVILEAASFDVAVIAFKTSATKEIFSNYPLLVDKTDVSCFIDKIKEYYSSDALRLKLREFHREVALKFNKDEYHSQIVELYNSL